MEEVNKFKEGNIGKSLTIVEKYAKKLGSPSAPNIVTEAWNVLHYKLSDKQEKENNAKDIIKSLVNHLPTKASQIRKSSSFTVISHFIESYDSLFSRVFISLILDSSDKKFLLKLSDFLFHSLDQQHAVLRMLSNKNIESSSPIMDLSSKKKLPSSLPIFHSFFLLLMKTNVNAINEYSTSINGVFKPTRLSMAFLNVFWNQCRFFSLWDITQYDNSLLRCTDEIVKVFGLMKLCYTSFPLYITVLDQCEEYIQYFNDWRKDSKIVENVQNQEINLSFVLRWEEYTSIIVSQQKLKLNSTQQKLLEHHLDAISSPENRSEANIIHHHLLCICLLFGKLQSNSISLLLPLISKYSLLSILQELMVCIEIVDTLNIIINYFNFR